LDKPIAVPRNRTIDALRGDNAHHQCETVFKAFARALRVAVEADPRAAGAIPSTKGSL
jgi:imidazoleglycerol-phosphate dehydratase